MPSLRRLAILCVLLVAVTAWAGEPSGPYGGWKWGHPTRGFRQDSGPAGKPGWVAVPGGLASTDSDLLVVAGGTVRLKTQGELDQDAADAAAAADTAQKTSRLAEFIAARDQLESLNAAKAEMNGVKILTRIDARITTAQARRDAAFTALRDLP